MSISEFSIKRPVTTMMVILSMVIMGALSLTTLKSQLFPDMNTPTATVVTTWRGASPEDMEKLVTNEIEDALPVIDGITKITTTSDLGVSQVIVEFEYGEDIDGKVNDLVTEVSRIRGLLPDDIDEPVIRKAGVGADIVMLLSITGDDLVELKSFAENIVQPRFERIDGSGEIRILGGLEKEVLVEVNPDKLEGYGLNISDIYSTLKGASLNFPSGYVREGDKEFLVRVLGEIETLEDVKNIVISNNNGSPLFLSDVANIRIDVKDADDYGRTDSKGNVLMFIQKSDAGNVLSIAEDIKKELVSLETQLPKGGRFTIVKDASEDVQNSINSVANNALTGLILAAIVLLVFLKNIRATLIVAIAIPVSVVATFMFFGAKGMTLNIISLMGLSLGVGMLVDNSIVVLDNIFRHLTELKKPRMEAARDGASEMVIPIIASTATTVAVFLPIVLREGLAKEIFQDMSFSIAFSLLASLIVAITFVPMVCSRVLDANTKIDAEGKILKALKAIYTRVLRAALNGRIIVIIITVALFFVVVVMGGKKIGGEFIPKQDDGVYTIIGEMPSGLDIEKVNRISESFEEIVAKDPRTKQFTASIEKEALSIIVDLGKPETRDYTVFEVVDEMRKEVAWIPDVKLNVVPSFARGSAQKDISVIFQSDDVDQLRVVADSLTKEMRKMPGLTDLSNSLLGGNPESRLVIDRKKLAYYGISITDLTFAISYQILGGAPITIKDGSNELDVTVQLEKEYRQSNELLLNSRIKTGSGESIKLSDVASLDIREGESGIDKEDSIRKVTLEANLRGGQDLVSAQNNIDNVIKGLNLPKSMTYSYGGDGEDLKEVGGQLAFAFAIAIFLIYFILASQFESYALPFIVMGSVPLSVIGVFLGLLITGEKTNVMVFVGIIMLAGIVVNNAIVLIDYINLLKARGGSGKEIIIEAGSTRLRPIIMTTMTTVFGMIPLAMGIGQGSELYKGMAIAVIFGLTFSTLLTLIFIPVLYSLYDSFLNFVVKKRGK